MESTSLNVLIVGASGFIGQHLLRRFAIDGARVEAWSRSSIEAPPGAEDRFMYRPVDLLSNNPLPMPPPGGWDVVFQLAGESRPSRFIGHEHLRNTVRMAARVAEHVSTVSAGCRYFLNSSAYVYGPSELPCDESASTEPTGPYGLAKLLAEDVTRLHQEKFHLTIVRPFNLIGADLPQGLFATGLLARLREGQSSVEVPAPNVRRDLLDIRDAIDAYQALLASKYESGTVFNFCSGSGTLSSEFATALLAALGKSCEIRFNKEAGFSILGSSDRLKAITNWMPRFQASDSARSLVEAQGG
ncbi:MAG: nucleoside-diphosphate-sugar epimerase [Planctomycetota bacterium]|jgi:nucleoside-diphosphate-sugar epimerase